MNNLKRARWANIFTTMVAMITVFQVSLLPTAPFPPITVSILEIVATYLVLALTAWKQYWSPDVSNGAIKTTFWIALATTIGGLANLTSILDFSEHTEELLKWVISLVVTAINILSKQLFPSTDQKEKMIQLKNS